MTDPSISEPMEEKPQFSIRGLLIGTAIVASVLMAVRVPVIFGLAFVLAFWAVVVALCAIALGSVAKWIGVGCQELRRRAGR